MTPRPLPDLRSVGSAVRLPTMVSSFMRMLPGMTTGAGACRRIPAGCSAVGLLVRLVVRVDDVSPDATPGADVQTLRFSPFTDLRNVIPAASATSAPVASPWRGCGLALHAPAFLEVGAEHIVEPLGIFFGEVDLVVLAVAGIGDGFGAFGLIQVVDQHEPLCHGFLLGIRQDNRKV